MDENKLSSISKTSSYAKIGEFWDTHEFTDFDDPELPDVEFTVTCSVPVDIELFSDLEQQARRRGIKLETLVNLWLKEKLDQTTILHATD